MERGRHDEARRLLERFEHASRADRLFRTTLLPVAARVLVALGDVGSVQALLEGPEPVSTRERLSTDSAHAVAAEARGDLRAAAERYRVALAPWRRYGMPLEEGQLLIGLARCEHGLGRRAEAEVAASAAIEVLTPLGARPLLQEAARLLGARTAAT